MLAVALIQHAGCLTRGALAPPPPNTGPRRCRQHHHLQFVGVFLAGGGSRDRRSLCRLYLGGSGGLVHGRHHGSFLRPKGHLLLSIRRCGGGGGGVGGMTRVFIATSRRTLRPLAGSLTDVTCPEERPPGAPRGLPAPGAGRAGTAPVGRAAPVNGRTACCCCRCFSCFSMFSCWAAMSGVAWYGGGGGTVEDAPPAKGAAPAAA
mmetsp:Transcript_19608/g.59309  ORF Transcript_19608/g.59309 Transcript_19608/m.59309 type:complete len:205 (+) Transcript_19608:2735-3349(+)